MNDFNSVNSVTLVGRIGKNPVIGMTAPRSGEPRKYAKFSLATTKSIGNADHTHTNATAWHSIVVWGRSADFCEKVLRKGMQLVVRGSLAYREVKDAKDPQAPVRYYTDIVADELTLLTPTKADVAAVNARQPTAQAAPEEYDDPHDRPF